MPTIVHFEIPFDDAERSLKFYTGLFGWKIDKVPDMDYYGVVTAEEGKGVNGGMMKRQAPEQQICNYIDVESVVEYAAKVEELGGKIIMPKTPVPGMGWFAICLDTENNAFGLWEEDKEAK